VGQKITGEIRQTASFLRKKGIRVTCLEFSYFQAHGGKHLLSYDIVTGKEPVKIKQISSGTLPVVSQDTFMESLDQNGKDFFEKLLQFAVEKSFFLRWGAKGFSMNVDKNGTYVVICYGYPPNAVYRQSIYTALVGRGGFLSKLEGAESEVKELWTEAMSTGLFQTAGRELKVLVNRRFHDHEVETITEWLTKLCQAIERHALK
jgi:hypothetical protein